MPPPSPNLTLILIVLGMVAAIMATGFAIRRWMTPTVPDDPAATWGMRKRRAGIVWSVVAGFCLLFGVAVLSNGPNQAGSRVPGIVIVAVSAVWLLIVQIHSRQQAKLGPPKPKVPAPATAPPAPAWVWVVVVAVFAMLLFWNGQTPKPPGPPALPAPVLVRAPWSLRLLEKVCYFALAAGILLMLVEVLIAKVRRRSILREDPEAHQRRMRLRGILWPAFVVVAGLCFALSGSLDGLGNWRPDPDPSRWFALIAFVASAVMLHVVFRLLAAQGPNIAPVAAPPPDPLPPTKPATPPPTSVWTKLLATVLGIGLLVGLSLLVLALKVNDPNGGDPVPPVAAGWACLGTFGVLAALIGWYVWVQTRKTSDPFASRATKRADAGDLDGAIAELAEVVELRGANIVRLNVLGLLYLQKEDWPAAISRFKEGYALDPSSFTMKNNLAVALQSGGRDGESEPILARLAEDTPGQPIVLINHARSLVDLGRLDDAEARLAQAEAYLARGVYPLQKDHDLAADAIAKVRAKLEEARGRKAGPWIEEL